MAVPTGIKYCSKYYGSHSHNPEKPAGEQFKEKKEKENPNGGYLFPGLQKHLIHGCWLHSNVASVPVMLTPLF